MQSCKYPEPGIELRQAFEEWLNEAHARNYIDEGTRNALNFTAGCVLTKFNLSRDDAHGLVMHYNDSQKIRPAGLFLSTVYNETPGQSVIYDLDTKRGLDFLGHRLSGNKILINQARTGDNMGHGAYGPVINFGETGMFMGESAKGPVINLNKCSYKMGESASGTVINFRDAFMDMGYESSGLVINFGSADGDLGECAKGPVINFGEAGHGMGDRALDFVVAVKAPYGFGYLKKARCVLREKACKKPELQAYLSGIKQRFEAIRQKIEAAHKENDTDYGKVMAALDRLGYKTDERVDEDLVRILRKCKIKYRRSKAIPPNLGKIATYRLFAILGDEWALRRLREMSDEMRPSNLPGH